MMEKCQGNLENLINGEIKSVEKKSIDSRIILGQLAVGLSNLHGEKIIHKDLKPNNILILVTSSHIIIKLADFGFSRLLPDGKQSFNPTSNLGTPIYRAPELQLPPAQPSWESDVWSLGAIFFFVISGGRHAYDVEGIQPRERVRLIEKLKVAPNMSCIVDNKKHLYVADLILALLSFNPKDRPSVHLVVHHPYFTSHNEMTRLFWAWKVSQFLTSAKCSGKFSSFLTGYDLMQWYDKYDHFTLTENERKEIQALNSSLSKMVNKNIKMFL